MTRSAARPDQLELEARFTIILTALRCQKDWDTVLAGLPKQGLFSINHPVRPSGEMCMGCGWDSDTDMPRVQAIEAVNGADADTPYSGIPFWQTHGRNVQVSSLASRIRLSEFER